MPSELTNQRTVSISDCDANGHWRPSAIMVAMQELGEMHSSALGLSRSSLLGQGMAWILYRQHIEMDVYPTFLEEVKMTTWPGAIEGPIFPRYFLLERPDGTPIGRATTSWILMDINTRRPMRPSALPGSVPANTERQAPLPLPGMLRVSDASPLLERTVQYSDIDVNGHMNNTRYIDWVCDALPYDALLGKGLAAWQINYISEAKPGETLALSSREVEGSTQMLGKRLSDGATVFETSVTLRG